MDTHEIEAEEVRRQERHEADVRRTDARTRTDLASAAILAAIGEMVVMSKPLLQAAIVQYRFGTTSAIRAETCALLIEKKGADAVDDLLKIAELQSK